jgi:hypothetical protein
MSGILNSQKNLWTFQRFYAIEINDIDKYLFYLDQRSLGLFFCQELKTSFVKGMQFPFII